MRVDGEFGCGIGVAWIMGAKRRHNLFASVAIASVDQNVSNQQPAANPASKIASNVMTSAT